MEPPKPVKNRRGRHSLKPWKYANIDELPDTKEAKAIVLGIEDAMRMPAVPQAWYPDLTGVWEDITGRKNSLVLNHAGNSFALWIAKFGTAEATQYLGLRHKGDVKLSRPSAPNDGVGTMILGGGLDPTITVDLPPEGLSSRIFTRVSKKVTLSDHAVQRLGGDHGAWRVRRLEHAPIATKVLREVREIVVGDELLDLIREFFNQSDPESIRDAGNKIDEHLRTLGHVDVPFAEEKDQPRGPYRSAGREAAPILNDYAHGLMKARPLTLSVASNFWRDIIGATGQETVASVFERLADVFTVLLSPPLEPLKPERQGLVHLEIPSPSKCPRFVYEFEAEAVGASGDACAGVSIYGGELRVRRTAPTEQSEPFVFTFLLGGASIGGSMGWRFRFKTKGTGHSAVAWTRADFLGRIETLEIVENSPGKSDGVTQWRIFGTGAKPVMVVDFGEASTHGVEAGGEIAGGLGYIRERDDPSGTEMPKFAPDVETDYVTAYATQADSHFELGSAALSEDGRNIVGWLAATELAALMNPKSSVHALGSADRVDVAWFNETLSKMRAKNTIQALKDAVGPPLRATTEAQGLGESIAAAVGDPDGHENPIWRRVWLSLCGERVASLKGGKSTT